MADRVLLLGWNRTVPGREQQAMQLFQKTMEFNAKLQSENRIEGFDAVILDAHGGDLNGFMILKGDSDKLVEIQADDAFIELTIEAGYCLQDFGVIVGSTGDGIKNILSRWEKYI